MTVRTDSMPLATQVEKAIKFIALQQMGSSLYLVYPSSSQIPTHVSLGENKPYYPNQKAAEILKLCSGATAQNTLMPNPRFC